MWVCEKECVYLREFPRGFHWTAVSSNTTNLGEFLPSAAAPLWTFVFASFFLFFFFCFFFFLGCGLQTCTPPTLPFFRPFRSRCFPTLHPLHDSPPVPNVQTSKFLWPPPWVWGPGSTQLCCVGCGSLALVRLPDWGSMCLEKTTLSGRCGNVEVWMWCGCR